jgi:hypothetical protein
MKTQQIKKSVKAVAAINSNKTSKANTVEGGAIVAKGWRKFKAVDAQAYGGIAIIGGHNTTCQHKSKLLVLEHTKKQSCGTRNFVLTCGGNGYGFFHSFGEGKNLKIYGSDWRVFRQSEKHSIGVEASTVKLAGSYAQLASYTFDKGQKGISKFDDRRVLTTGKCFQLESNGKLLWRLNGKGTGKYKLFTSTGAAYNATSFKTCAAK